ncbi:FapA family protein [Faecalicatena sp. AGMB00832]|uniref:FapA family protein n=1 Tax=Faecalicatena faecalis TaxID=2726362 RepID=A0ABS6D983_9FIRM|nr:FapA family protein [Faecalicatena faecalis]MBU3878160.1 FapA family protein [Faecalicatena faecalis]
MDNRYDNDSDYDSMIETVEDWNDADMERKKEAASYMDGSAQPELTEKDILGDMFDDWDDDLELEEEEGEAKDEAEPELEPESKDACVELTVQDDKMAAMIFVSEPEGNGQDVTRQMILDALNKKGIVYGVDSKRINEIVEKKAYRQMFQIAEGKPPIDGKNGRIKDYFPRKRELKFAQTGNGGIDFKTMNLIHNVKKGDVVCEISMPEEPLDGIDVFGRPAPGKRGKMPPIPQGRNIVYSEKKDKLLTGCEGNLTFRNGRFHVENVYEVAGNVDNSVGNINFTGSVYIHGDVFEGYSVKAKGDITVVGMVEGAELIAGGDILLHKGMRGMKTGILKSGGNVTGKFLEDCTIYAKGNVEAEYIINSQVSCEKDVILAGKKGAFIGGRCAVCNTMRVKVVGAMSHVPTEVILGVTPELLDRMEQTKQELAEVTKKLIDCKKDMDYLTAKQQAGTITEKQKHSLNDLKIREPVNKMMLKQLRKRLAEMNQRIQEVGKSRLVADIVHEGTVIRIGNAALTIKRQEECCSFYLVNGEIQKGMR